MGARLATPSPIAVREPTDRARSDRLWYDPDAASFNDRFAAVDGALRGGLPAPVTDTPAVDVVDPHSILSALPVAAFVAGFDGRILVANDHADALLAGTLAGRTIDELVPASRRPLRALLRRVFSGSGQSPSSGGHAALLARRRDGADCRLDLSLTAIQTASGAAILAIMVATSAAAATVEELARQARTDALTGLGNHAALLAALSRRFRKPVAEGPLVVLTIEVDGLRETNRRHGRAAGDALLRRYAARLVATVRTADLVARTGGDEFVILCDGPLEAGRAIAARLIGSSTERRSTPTSSASLAASIGLAVRSGRERSSTLLRRADAAVLAARAAGRHQVVEAA